MAVQLRQQRKWDASQELQRQLDELQREMQRVVTALEEQHDLAPKPILIRKAGTYHAKNGDFVVVEIGTGAVTVVLPEPTQGKAASIYVIRVGTTGTVTVVPKSGTINGTASITVNTSFRHFLNAGTTWGAEF